MKSKILITTILGVMFLSGCSVQPMKEPDKKLENKKEPKVSHFTQMNESLMAGSLLREISNPGLILPKDIEETHIKKYFELDNLIFALVLRSSMNVLLEVPSDFSGVLIAEKGDPEWKTLLEIQDLNPDKSSKNNPYYLFIDKKKLLLTIVDQNGAGSGEGIMKVFALSEKNDWNLDSCYYFGGSYNDPTTDGDYFAFSTKFSKQTIQQIESCDDHVRLIKKE